MPTKKYVEEGHCPNCGFDNLVYGNFTMQNNTMWIPFHCSLCDFTGIQNHTLKFISYSYDDENNNLKEIFEGELLLKKRK